MDLQLFDPGVFLAHFKGFPRWPIAAVRTMLSPGAGRATSTVTLTGQYIRTVIVADSPDLTRAACGWVENEPGVIVVATFDTGFAALVAVDVLRPDLVLMEVAAPGLEALGTTRRIKARPEAPAVVLIAPHDPADIAAAARDAGADAVISKRELGEPAGSVLRALGAKAGRSTA